MWVAWASAGIDLAIAGCLEKHGTGTELGDRFELAASAEAFAGATRIGIGIGSVKSNLGQLDTAAGIAGLIKTFLMLEKRVLAATVNVTSPTLNSLTDPLPSSSLA
ncbi:hypothetical protein SAZ_42645 [Streptomyces noursei ZPM]|nr:hypothetical protein SAZ_00160 [Streptomyces noursei ZPM]AKA09322.1 hypothetical protein SAZ_42645 [Streptomyces noursei ZPM]EOT02554.1 hypothetical protein K530_18121 [Streptomyces noursei CCRC 11814]EXU92459.1 hypothetical protein P354_21250 [Streptomyces noursei PD-1]